MAAKTVTFYYRINGVLTDADTVEFSDLAGTYGVRRRDTLDPLQDYGVGVALSHIATGTYQSTITGMVAGAPYEYKVKAVKTGSPNRSGGGSFTAPADDTAEYINDLALDLELGWDNADLHADLDNDIEAEKITTMRLDAVGIGIVRADLELDSLLTDAELALITDGSKAAGVRALAARKYAAGELLNKRGKQASVAGGLRPGDEKFLEADVLIAKLVLMVREEDDTVAAGSFEFAPIRRDVCDATGDENYRPLLWY